MVGCGSPKPHDGGSIPSFFAFRMSASTYIQFNNMLNLPVTSRGVPSPYLLIGGEIFIQRYMGPAAAITPVYLRAREAKHWYWRGAWIRMKGVRKDVPISLPYPHPLAVLSLKRCV